MNENGGGKRLSAAPANTECTAAGGSTELESVGRLVELGVEPAYCSASDRLVIDQAPVASETRQEHPRA